MKLYKLTLKNYRSLYVIADNFDEAEKKLMDYLEHRNYYFTGDRVVILIEVIAKEDENNIFNSIKE